MFTKKGKMFRSLVLAMLVLFLMAGSVQAAELGSRTLYWGSRGQDVSELQTALNKIGYKSGPVDGIFGPLTYGAVYQFQKAYNLLVDGIAGPQTIGALIEIKAGESGPAAPAAANAGLSDYEVDLFARLVHSEAAGESFEGQVAVAASVLNRVDSPRYPNTVSGVIKQVWNGHYQYSPVLDGRINIPAGESARRAVKEALQGRDPSGGALGFYNPRKTNNAWVRSQPVTRVIGQHIFFR